MPDIRMDSQHRQHSWVAGRGPRQQRSNVEQLSSSDFSTSFESSQPLVTASSAYCQRSRSRSTHSYSSSQSVMSNGERSDRGSKGFPMSSSSQLNNGMSRNGSLIHFPEMYNSVSGSSFDNMSPQSSLLMMRSNKEQICCSNYDSDNGSDYGQNYKLMTPVEAELAPTGCISNNYSIGSNYLPSLGTGSSSKSLVPQEALSQLQNSNTTNNLTQQQQIYLQKYIQQQQGQGSQQISQFIQKQIQIQSLSVQQQLALQQQLTLQLQSQIQDNVNRLVKEFVQRNAEIGLVSQPLKTNSSQSTSNSSADYNNGRRYDQVLETIYPFSSEVSSTLPNEPVLVSNVQTFRPPAEFYTQSSKIQKPQRTQKTVPVINSANLSDINIFGRSCMPYLNIPFSVHDTAVLCEKYITEVIMNPYIDIKLEEAILDTKPEFLKYGNNDYERMFTHQCDNGRKPEKQKYFCYVEKRTQTQEKANLTNIITHQIYVHKSKLSTWLAHVANKGKLGSNELVYVTLFLRRLRFKYNVLITPENVHALALSCLSLGLKTHSDVWFCLGSFEYLGESKHPKIELYRTEMAIIFACNFDFFVSYFEIFGFLKTLLDLWLLQSNEN